MVVIRENEFNKVKNPENFIYKIYELYPTRSAYAGEASIAAESIEAANEIIEKFKEDNKGNMSDSFGYPIVKEHHWNGEYTDEKFFIKGIWYQGV